MRFHVENVYAKLGVRTRLDAVERARQLCYLSETNEGRRGSGAGRQRLRRAGSKAVIPWRGTQR